MVVGAEVLWAWRWTRGTAVAWSVPALTMVVGLVPYVLGEIDVGL